MVQSDRDNSIGCQFIPHEIITVQQPRRELPDSIRTIMIADVGQETFEVFTADIFGHGDWMHDGETNSYGRMAAADHLQRIACSE
jgi:hypothetical protein